jgi:NADPH:quinone reductase-like Zn-dependent oxidoreductase
MKAFVYTQYGTTDVLQFKEVEKPMPKPNEVLIKIIAVSINDWDWQLLLGKPFINRMINGLRAPKKQILGCDIAGRIEAVGSNVRVLKSGDEVYGDISNYWGGFAEYACAPENLFTLKPAGMSFEQAAAIPQAGMLAVQGLIDLGQIKPNQKILINGAGGGVGTFAVQIAKLYDAEVTGVDHSEKFEMMRSIGFDKLIDYTKEDFTKNGQQYDLILDNKTNRSIFAYINSLSPNGTYATTGGLIRRLLQAIFVSFYIKIILKKNIRIVALKPNKDLAYMNELFESAKMKPIIDRTFKLIELPEALQYFGEGHHKGKIVIKI